MKKVYIIIIIIGVLFSITGCTENAVVAPNSKDTKETLTQGGHFYLKQDEAYLNMREDKSIVLLDVRTPQEYAEVHIPGSILIPLDKIKDEAKDKLTDKNALIYVYCRSGNRSDSAAKILVELGYTKVYNIGGIASWPYETEKGGSN